MSKPDCWLTPDEIDESSQPVYRAATDDYPDTPEISSALRLAAYQVTCTAQICARLDRLIEVLEAGAPKPSAGTQPHDTCAQCGETWEWHQAHHPRHQFVRSMQDYPDDD